MEAPETMFLTHKRGLWYGMMHLYSKNESRHGLGGQSFRHYTNGIKGNIVFRKHLKATLPN